MIAIDRLTEAIIVSHHRVGFVLFCSNMLFGSIYSIGDFFKFRLECSLLLRAEVAT
jgi:hypothetical protein